MKAAFDQRNTVYNMQVNAKHVLKTLFFKWKNSPHMHHSLKYVSNTRWMHDIVGRAWASAHAESGPGACTGLPSECDWTSGHRIPHKKVHTCTTQELWVRLRQSIMHTGWSSTCCRSCGDGMDRWSHLSWHVLPVTPIAVARRDLSPVTGAVSHATKTNGTVRLPRGPLSLWHWVGKSTSSLRPCCCQWGRSTVHS